MLMLTSTRLTVHHQKWNPNRPSIWKATLASLRRYQHLAMFTLEWYINLRSTSPLSLVHSPTSATWADRHGGAASIRHWKWWRPDLRSFSKAEFYVFGNNVVESNRISCSLFWETDPIWGICRSSGLKASSRWIPCSKLYSDSLWSWFSCFRTEPFLDLWVLKWQWVDWAFHLTKRCI